MLSSFHTTTNAPGKAATAGHDCEPQVDPDGEQDRDGDRREQPIRDGACYRHASARTLVADVALVRRVAARRGAIGVVQFIMTK